MKRLFPRYASPLLAFVLTFSAGCWGGPRFADDYDEVPERRSPSNVLTREDIDAYPTNYSLEQVLVQAYPSMRPGQISIRGMGPPLFVIDGVPTENAGAALGINARNIERIELIRGGAAALYGFRGSNGAILVSTRR